MSHSRKKAFVRISKRMQENVHSVARSLVKRILKHADPKEPEDKDLSIIDSDVKELGLEDWGTKFGLEFTEEEDWKDDKERMRRK